MRLKWIRYTGAALFAGMVVYFLIMLGNIQQAGIHTPLLKPVTLAVPTGCLMDSTTFGVQGAYVALSTTAQGWCHVVAVEVRADARLIGVMLDQNTIGGQAAQILLYEELGMLPGGYLSLKEGVVP